MRPTSATAARRRSPKLERAENNGTPAWLGVSASASLDKRAWRPHGKRRTHSLGKISMKAIASGLLALGLLAVQISEADAAACAAGLYHAGCVGPRGAVATTRPYGYH